MSRGFTLIEIVVYLLLLALALVLVINMLLGLTQVFNQVRLTREINQAAETALERLVRVSRAAAGVDLVASSLGTDPAVLVLTQVTGGSGGTVFRVSNGELTLQTDNNRPEVLISQPLTIDSFIVSRVATGTTQAIRFKLTISGKRGGQSRTENFETGAVLRASYVQ